VTDLVQGTERAYEVKEGLAKRAGAAARSIVAFATRATDIAENMPDTPWSEAVEPFVVAFVRAANLASLVEVRGAAEKGDPDPPTAGEYLAAIEDLTSILKENGEPLGEDLAWVHASQAANPFECLCDAVQVADDGPPPDFVEKPAVRGVTALTLSRLSQPELLSFNRRLHQIWGANVSGNEDPDTDLVDALVRAKALVLVEFRRRGIESRVDDELTRRARAVKKADLFEPDELMADRDAAWSDATESLWQAPHEVEVDGDLDFEEGH
jgi:hypothetical protein